MIVLFKIGLFLCHKIEKDDDVIIGYSSTRALVKDHIMGSVPHAAFESFLVLVLYSHGDIIINNVEVDADLMISEDYPGLKGRARN